jgi:hypothetical protein
VSRKQQGGKAAADPIGWALDHGWIVAVRRGGHLKLTHPCGALVFTGSTPSDHRARKNLLGQLRRECTCEAP